jgi:hypothetical protein
VTGKPFNEFKKSGGIFTTESMPEYVQSAVVDNLLHTIRDCVDESNRTNAYTDSLYGIGAAVIYKAVISILKSAVEEAVKEHFAEKAQEKNIADLGEAISGWSKEDKRDIKDRIAESLTLYRNFTEIKDPVGVIEALIEFLVKIGCLLESSTAMSDYGRQQKTYYFSHNALMSFAVEETVASVLELKDVSPAEFTTSIRQAAEGVLNENIVYAHVLLSAGKDDKVFKYRDLEGREVDIVVVNRVAKTLRLIEVKSKNKISAKNVFGDEAKHLYNDAILRNIGVDDTFEITRVVAYMGKSAVIPRREDALILANIEELISHYKDLGHYLGQMTAHADQLRKEREPEEQASSLLGKLAVGKEKSKQQKQSVDDKDAKLPDNRGGNAPSI